MRLRLDGPATFEVMCAVLLNPLIAYGLDSPVVVCHLLFSLGRVAGRLRSADQALALESFVERIAAVSQKLLKEGEETRSIERAVAGIKSTLAQRVSIPA